MIPTQTLVQYPVFGNAACIVKPDNAKYAAGFLPADVLPAEWHNYFLNTASSAITCLNAGVSSMEAELNCVVTNAGLTPAEGTTGQVAQAISCCVTNAVTRSIQITDSSKTNCGSAVNFTSSTALQIALPSTICATLQGNAATATLATCAQKDGSGCSFGTAARYACGCFAPSANYTKAICANGFWGLATPSGGTSDWTRTTSCGIIPYQSGAAGSGHQSIGTSSWYFSGIYVDCINGCSVGCLAVGCAAKLKDHGGCATTFCWSGNNANPTWVWGSSSRGTTCVYNPRCFTVLCADSATSAGSATSATSATNSCCAKCDGSGCSFGTAARYSCGCFTRAANGDTNCALYAGAAVEASCASCLRTFTAATTCAITKFWWIGCAGQPTWLWGGSAQGNMYVYNPANFSVNYATSAGTATSASSATTAGTATCAIRLRGSSFVWNTDICGNTSSPTAKKDMFIFPRTKGAVCFFKTGQSIPYTCTCLLNCYYYSQTY